MTARRVLIATVTVLFTGGAFLVAGGQEMNQQDRACWPITIGDDVGADYAHGVWVDRHGAIIGHSLEEDSPIYNDADCV